MFLVEEVIIQFYQLGIKNFIIKTINKEEKKVLKNMLKNYIIKD